MSGARHFAMSCIHPSAGYIRIRNRPSSRGASRLRRPARHRPLVLPAWCCRASTKDQRHARFPFGVTGVAHGRRNVSVGEIPVRFHAGSDATTTAVHVAEAMKRTTVDSYDVRPEAARSERVGSTVGAGRRGLVMPGCADPGPVVALAIPGWNNLTARVFSVVPAEGRCDRWGAATTEWSRRGEPAVACAAVACPTERIRPGIPLRAGALVPTCRVPRRRASGVRVHARHRFLTASA